jgi:Mn2+/Fe2+ NRAMP family transporter
MAAVSTGDFRRFERRAMALVFASLRLIPIYLMIHPSLDQIAYDLTVPRLPQNGKPSEIMLLIIAIVGTTIAPWQLFFQQSYVIDKRITPRFMRYELLDLWIGIALVTVGVVAVMSFAAATFAGRVEFGAFVDAGQVALGLEKYAGKMAGIMFAIALIDAALIGAAAVSLSTAYAIGDVLSLCHSLHRPVGEAKGFYVGLFPADRCGRRDRVNAWGATRAVDKRGAHFGRGIAAERNRFSAPIVQRQGGAGAVGEFKLA